MGRKDDAWLAGSLVPFWYSRSFFLFVSLKYRFLEMFAYLFPSQARQLAHQAYQLSSQAVLIRQQGALISRLCAANARAECYHAEQQ